MLVAIDELHVVEQWGKNWRPDYSRLAILRSRIDRRVPWFGTSATLDPLTLEEVKTLAGFDADVEVHKTSVDRPDIRLEIRAMQHTASSFRDLEFVIEAAQDRQPQAADALKDRLADALACEPANQTQTEALRGAIRRGQFEAARSLIRGENLASIALAKAAEHNERRKQLEERKQAFGIDDHTASRRRCQRIPKTVIYMEKIKDIEFARQRLISWLVQTGCSKAAAADAIKVYHGELADFDKEAISNEFSKPDCDDLNKCSRHRIILATDAMGMGIDNPDIKRVVQYRLPDSINVLWQRAGRVARSAEATGEFIWLVDSWCFGPMEEQFEQMSKEPEEDENISSSEYSAPARQSRGKVAAFEAKRRSNLPRGFWELINKKSCLRRTFLKFLGENLDNFQSPQGSCCSRCSVSSSTAHQPQVLYKVPYVQSGAKITKVVREDLLAWRASKAPSQFKGSLFSNPSILMPDSIVTIISRAADSIVDISSLAELSSHKWAFFETFGLEVLQIVERAKESQKTLIRKRTLAEAPITRRGPQRKRQRIV